MSVPVNEHHNGCTSNKVPHAGHTRKQAHKRHKATEGLIGSEEDIQAIKQPPKRVQPAEDCYRNS